MHIKDIFSGFSVTNLDKAQEFYAATLALEVKRDQMGIQISLPSGGEVFIYEKADHTPATFTVLNIVVESIDVAIDDLTAKGISFEKYQDLPAPQDNKGVLRGKAANMGPDIAWFTDPSGNILALLES